jgi:hypothetical protein
VVPVKTTGPPSVWSRTVRTPLGDLSNAKFSYAEKYGGVVVDTGPPSWTVIASAAFGENGLDEVSESGFTPAVVWF